MKNVNIQLEQLICPSCVKKIESVLKKQDGVEEVNILFTSSKAKVKFDESKINTDKIVELINNVGFEVLSTK